MIERVRASISRFFRSRHHPNTPHPLQDLHHDSGLEEIGVRRGVLGGLAPGQKQSEMLLFPGKDLFDCGNGLRVPDQERSHQSRIKHRAGVGDGEEGLR